MSWFWVNEVVSDLIFPFSNDLLAQNERQADYRNLIVHFETKVMIYRKKLNFQDKKIAKSTEKNHIYVILENRQGQVRQDHRKIKAVKLGTKEPQKPSEGPDFIC